MKNIKTADAEVAKLLGVDYTHVMISVLEMPTETGMTTADMRKVFKV